MGAVIAMVWRYDWFQLLSSRTSNKALLILLCCVSIIIAPYYITPHVRLRFSLMMELLPVLSIGLILVTVMRSASGIVALALNWPPILFVGRMSFSLYLWQQLPTTYPMGGSGVSTPAAVALSFIFAAISFYLVEVPMLKIRNRLFPAH